ncbi:hypothetical protein Pint_08060 [Pistacia integerrima]|uniref:Uncharacterized protein n=1 Tax=Pistacia integerrima TaxID=434235 RepID=A0ACC0XUP2_9ROSI|nr:hypothetical protein Pint_08060 [Pistacia integerrima]
MVSHGTPFQLILLVEILLIAATAATLVSTIAKPGCNDTCGDVKIPYPFGTTPGCYFNEDFFINCSYVSNPPKPFLWHSNIDITNISLEGRLQVPNSVTRDCYTDGEPNVGLSNSWSSMRITRFTVSNTENKFTVIGCDSYAYINGSIEKTQFSFSSAYLSHLPEDQYPMVLDWSITGHGQCEEANSSSSYACKENSECYVREEYRDGSGYLCKCKDGYEGNPYLSNGCRDIDECQYAESNKCTHLCSNEVGSYTCKCPRGYHGNGIKGEDGCNPNPPNQFPVVKVAMVSNALNAGVGIFFVVLLVSSTWLHLVLKRRKLMKLKEKFFQQNGGLLLQQQLSKRSASSETAKIFAAEELKTATNNYDESRIIGRGGFGTVYKGFLADNRPVAIKKSKIIDKSQTEQFVNEVVVLSQINHRNVVRLLGCCLETEVPLLVYEFVNNESCLFEILENHIVNDGNEEQLKEVAELAKICLNVKGEERPTMREVAMELDGLRMMHKHSWVNAELNPEETQRLLYDNSDVYKYGDGSNTTAGYDSLKDHVLEVLDDGR